MARKQSKSGEQICCSKCGTKVKYEDRSSLTQCKTHCYCKECFATMFNGSKFAPKCKECKKGIEIEKVISPCSICARERGLNELRFPCNHRVCKNCYSNYLKTVIHKFEQISNPKNKAAPRQGFFSVGLGCVKECQESTHLFSASYIVELSFLNRDDTATLSRNYPYFEGIDCEFRMCKNCKKYTIYCSRFQWKCFACGKCILCILTKQNNRHLAECPKTTHSR